MGNSAMARRYGSACLLSESTSVNDGGEGFGGLVELEDGCCWWPVDGPAGGPGGGSDAGGDGVDG